MNYIYDRYWGLFYKNYIDPNNIVGVGYSGNSDMVNDLEFDNEENAGCLPAGKYTLSGPFTNPEKGPRVFNLIPNLANNMKGRSGFMIHGDTESMNHTASDGCIVSPPWTRAIFKDGDILTAI
jgi:hypothetical protein